MQPERDRNWRGWLYRTAQREAWRLRALSWKERELVNEDGVQFETADPRDSYAERLEFEAALQELRKLPTRLQQVVLIRSQVWKQDDVAEIMGISRPRVAQLLVDAGMRVAELNEQRHDAERPVASPRGNVGLLAQPVDARPRPEVHEDDMAPQPGGPEWLGVKPLGRAAEQGHVHTFEQGHG